jgi:hypothetical protein
MQLVDIEVDPISGNRNYFIGDKQLPKSPIEDEPLFLAQDVEQLRNDPKTRQYLK